MVEEDLFSSWESVTEIDLFKISGKVGANVTGVSVGGVEQSNSHYLVAFNSINQQNNYTYTSFELIGGDPSKRDIFVYAINKDFDNDHQEVVKTTIAKYAHLKTMATTPTLVKVNENRFVVLWQEYTVNDLSLNGAGDVKYVELNGRGETDSAIKTAPNFLLSEVQPIVKDNKIIWYTIEDKRKVLYVLELN